MLLSISSLLLVLWAAVSTRCRLAQRCLLLTYPSLPRTMLLRFKHYNYRDCCSMRGMALLAAPAARAVGGQRWSRRRGLNGAEDGVAATGEGSSMAMVCNFAPVPSPET